MRTPPPSPKAMAAAGWTREPGPPGKCNARWAHVRGWRIEHCGHPTANHPWALYAPDRRMILTGVQYGNPPTFGTAWDGLADVIEWVASAPARAFEVQP
mgnify:FL=1